MTGMNEQVREAVRHEMEKRELTQGELAASVGMERANVNRLLSGRSGRVPESWQTLLDALDLELIAVPKKNA